MADKIIPNGDASWADTTGQYRQEPPETLRDVGYRADDVAPSQEYNHMLFEQGRVAEPLRHSVGHYENIEDFIRRAEVGDYGYLVPSYEEALDRGPLHSDPPGVKTFQSTNNSALYVDSDGLHCVTGGESYLELWDFSKDGAERQTTVDFGSRHVRGVTIRDGRVGVLHEDTQDDDWYFTVEDVGSLGDLDLASPELLSGPIGPTNVLVNLHATPNLSSSTEPNSDAAFLCRELNDTYLYVIDYDGQFYDTIDLSPKFPTDYASRGEEAVIISSNGYIVDLDLDTLSTTDLGQLGSSDVDDGAQIESDGWRFFGTANDGSDDYIQPFSLDLEILGPGIDVGASLAGFHVMGTTIAYDAGSNVEALDLLRNRKAMAPKHNPDPLDNAGASTGTFTITPSQIIETATGGTTPYDDVLVRSSHIGRQPVYKPKTETYAGQSALALPRG